MPIVPMLEALALVALANGTPVIVKKVAGPRLAVPLDGGRKFLDGRPLFGKSKTVRGVLSSLAITAAAAPLLGVSIALGALAAVLAMVGDLFSSFTKRRLGFPPSTQAIGLDQIPESLFPLLALQREFALSLADITICVAIFLAAELIVSRILYKLRVRDQPY
jgi:CDP-2,3-bis-(O-geranylgeranyl)-sn-glycerol synthase